MDVETADSFANPAVYDLGFAICDKKGNIYERRSFLISEIFDNSALMDTAYYKSKMPLYLEKLAKGEIKKVPFAVARDSFLTLLETYRVSQISAYNLNFDMNALSKTTKRLGGKKFLTSKQSGIELKDIWSFACETLYTQKTFQKQAVLNGWLTEKMNVQTSAEIGYRYISGNHLFIEEHTGLADVEIECKILAHCYKQRKKHLSGILGNPWQLVNNKYFKELRAEYEELLDY